MKITQRFKAAKKAFFGGQPSGQTAESVLPPPLPLWAVISETRENAAEEHHAATMKLVDHLDEIDADAHFANQRIRFDNAKSIKTITPVIQSVREAIENYLRTGNLEDNEGYQEISAAIQNGFLTVSAAKFDDETREKYKQILTDLNTEIQTGILDLACGNIDKKIEDYLSAGKLESYDDIKDGLQAIISAVLSSELKEETREKYLTISFDMNTQIQRGVMDLMLDQADIKCDVVCETAVYDKNTATESMRLLKSAVDLGKINGLITGNDATFIASVYDHLIAARNSHIDSGMSRLEKIMGEYVAAMTDMEMTSEETGFFKVQAASFMNAKVDYTKLDIPFEHEIADFLNLQFGIQEIDEAAQNAQEQTRETISPGTLEIADSELGISKIFERADAAAASGLVTVLPPPLPTNAFAKPGRPADENDSVVRQALKIAAE